MGGAGRDRDITQAGDGIRVRWAETGPRAVGATGAGEEERRRAERERREQERRWIMAEALLVKACGDGRQLVPGD